MIYPGSLNMNVILHEQECSLPADILSSFSLTDPNISKINSEERLNHETQELEKRLSMLSNRNSTGTYYYFPEMGTLPYIAGPSSVRDLGTFLSLSLCPYADNNCPPSPSVLVLLKCFTDNRASFLNWLDRS